MALLALIAGCSDKKKIPPNPDVVATYNNGEITIENLENYINQRTEGLKVLVGDSLISLKDQIPRNQESYRGLIREMVLDDMVKLKIKEKQLDNRGNIRHALEHIEDNLTLQELHGEMHESNRIPVDELEILEYFNQNRTQFGDKSINEVRDEIKTILVSQKEGGYVTDYISELKDAATITKNYELLRLPEPTEEEVWEAYERDKESYREPEQWVIEQLEIADTTAAAGATAQRVWAKLGSGESLEAVAKEFGKDNTYANINYSMGMREEVFDNAVNSLNLGEFSKPIREGKKYFIVRLKEKIPASYLPFEIVKGVVRRFLTDEREKKVYEENKNKTLFTLHGRRFTLGDFYQEFMELSPAEQEMRRTYEARTQLVDRMIERLLLLEDSYDRMLNAKKKEEIEHVREDMLKQVLHREEVDQKLEVSDEEVKKSYAENKAQFQTPARVKISIIVVQGSEDESAGRKAKEKIEEAYEKLQSGFFKKGMLFEEVARQYSEDPSTAQKGGQLDYWIGETNDPMYELFNHTLHEKLVNLKKGEMTEPFSLEHDYLIVKVREIQESRPLPFEEVKDHLKEDLKMKKHEKLTVDMYNKMIDQANLVIYDQVLESIAREPKEVSRTQ